MLKNLNKYAFILWTMLQFHNTITNVFEAGGMHRFEASGVANRFFAIVVLFVLIGSINFKRIRYHPAIFILFGFIFYSLVNNPFLAVFTDMTLLLIPVAFFLYSKNIIANKTGFSHVLESYYRLNLVSFPFHLIFLVLGLSPYVLSDLTFMICYKLALLISSQGREGVNKPKTISSIVVFLIGSISKTAIFQFVLIMLPRFFSLKRFAGVAIAFSLAAAGVVTFATELSKFSGSFSRGVELVKRTQFNELLSARTISVLYRNPEMIFTFTDRSTGERLYELLLAANATGSSPASMLFGQGFGGGIDLSNTSDNAVKAVHSGDISAVRVVHMMLTFVLLKFGLLGIAFFLFFTLRAFGKYFLVIKNSSRYDFFIVFAYTYLASMYVGAFFTFGNYIKLPFTGVAIFLIWKYSRSVTAEPAAPARMAIE